MSENEQLLDTWVSQNDSLCDKDALNNQEIANLWMTAQAIRIVGPGKGQQTNAEFDAIEAASQSNP